MDVRKWPMDRILQLPDCCFGRRWAVCNNVSVASTATGWDISELSLPNEFVLWELLIFMSFYGEAGITVRIAMGNTLPTSAAEMNRLEPLIPGFGVDGPAPRYINMSYYITPSIKGLKMPIMSGGKKMILEATAGATNDQIFQTLAVISSFPKEVPDWLVSGQGSHLA